MPTENVVSSVQMIDFTRQEIGSKQFGLGKDAFYHPLQYKVKTSPCEPWEPHANKTGRGSRFKQKKADSWR